jgi:cobalt-zinc-cadmium efflux system protein
MLLVLGWIVFEAVERLREPEPVKGGVVFIIAFVGLLVNGWVAHLLSRGEMIGVNRRAALLHVLSDLLGSVVALAAGLVIILTGWLAIDPLLSLLVAGLIAYATINLLRDLGGKGHRH